VHSLPKTISAREQGAALIIVLAFVVLLTAVSVAYFSRATGDRQVAHSSFNQTKVDELAAAATNYIVNDLFDEIVSGSNATTVNNVTVYSPATAANMLPRRSGNPGGNPDPIPNLVRRSWTGDTTLNEASNVNSTTPSANSRFITAVRWDKHYLIPQANLGNFTAPDWVVITRNGRADYPNFPEWDASLANAAPSNLSYAVGRYAYAIYDEGGLLDANVAGYPTNLTAGKYGPKGVSAFADLSVLGFSTGGINSLVGWRNYASSQLTASTFPNFTFTTAQANNYVSGVLSNTNGFLSVGTQYYQASQNSGWRTDQMFPNRQSLIQLFLAPSSPFSTDALQYLGTFLRELNTPSWTPTLNATDMGAPDNGTGNIYAYRDNAANQVATPINPNLVNVRVQNSFTRADGNTAVVGEPLIDRRFPVTRLAGLGPSGIVTTAKSTTVNGLPSVATAATIQRDFGLVWNSGSNHWDYAGPSGTNVLTSIETLWQVANENPGREPNFFELLKAAILDGSVGMGSGSGNTFVQAQARYYDNTGTSAPKSSDYQIMQIGANIINQWDSGNVPIFFNFYDNTGNYELAGIKNLPYLNKIVFKPYWHTQGPTNYFDAWILPGLWNPHQNAPTPASQNVRVQMTLGASVTAAATAPSASAQITSTSFMTFNSSSANFGPAPSAATSVIGNQSSNNVTATPNGHYGFHFPQMTLTGSPSGASTAYPDFGTSCTFELQVQVNGNWKSYQKWKGCAQPSTMLVYSNPLSNPQNDTTLQDPEFVALDPRTVRFGIWGNDGSHSGTPQDYNNGTQYSLDSTLNSPSLPVEPITALPPQGSWFTLGTSSPYSLYQYANNSNTGSNAHYVDLDQVQRIGDFPTAGDAADPANNQLQPTLSAVRPLALNGAFQNGVFQSVAELDHVFRGQPWKTLTFTSAMPTTSITKSRSADAGLLDVFTLHESSMEAGKTSLNTRQPLVLKAILSQATKSIAGTTTITSTELNNIVTALTNLTSSQSMVNKTELVTPNLSVSSSRTALVSDASVTGLGNKAARECVLRAFSDACQTRTWNLMVDLVVQSGRYPPNANSLAGFMVEGETHYWVHIAIDRFTGQLIDKQIEVVNE
jgi:hypothetical protein